MKKISCIGIGLAIVLSMSVKADLPAANQLIAQNTKTKKQTIKKKKSSGLSKKQSQDLFQRAIDYARNKKYDSASRILFQISRDPRYANDRYQIRYTLGLMLFQMGFYQSAGYQFVSVVRDGNNLYVKKSLEKLSAAADLLNDRTLLNYSMAKIKVEDFPKESWDMLRYRIGEFQYEKKLFKEASDNLVKVRPESKFYSKAKYLQGLSLAEMGQTTAAYNAFDELSLARENSGVTDNNRVAATLAKARVLYQAKKWDEALEVYREIPRDTRYWHDALFEMSWTYMRDAKFRSVLGNFQSLHSPFYEDYYIPETLLLRSIVYLYICQYREMEKTLDLYNKVYDDIHNRLKSYLQSRPSPEDYYKHLKETVSNYKSIASDSKKKRGTKIPMLVALKIIDEGDVIASQNYINNLNVEKNKIKKMPSAWLKSEIGVASLKLVERRLAAANRKVGLQIKAHIFSVLKELSEISEQVAFARFELVNSEKENLKKEISTTNPETDVTAEQDEKMIDESDETREFYVQNGYQYWPFKGEYWLDEIGNFFYLGNKSCE